VTYQSEVLSDSPTLYCPMDETSGNFLDRSGNGNHATYSGPRTGTSFFGASAPQGAPFSGGGNNVVWATTALDAVQTVETWECWVKTSTTGNSANIQFFGKGDLSGAGTQSAWLGMGSAGNAGKAIFIVLSGGTTMGVASSVNVNDGAWHHIVGVYNGTDLRIYFDGALSGTVAGTGTINGNTQDITAGTPSADGFPSSRFTGQLWQGFGEVIATDAR